jgi:hypothetical protein
LLFQSGSLGLGPLLLIPLGSDSSHLLFSLKFLARLPFCSARSLLGQSIPSWLQVEVSRTFLFDPQQRDRASSCFHPPAQSTLPLFSQPALSLACALGHCSSYLPFPSCVPQKALCRSGLRSPGWTWRRFDFLHPNSPALASVQGQGLICVFVLVLC